MSKGRVRRNLIPIVLSIITTIIIFRFKITPAKIYNYVELASGILSMSSIATSFLLASFSLISTRQNSRFFKVLVQLKTDIKLLDRLLVTVLGFFICSILSLAALTLNAKNNNLFGQIVVSLTGGTLLFSLLEQIVIFEILFKGIKVMYSDRSSDNK